MSTSNICNYSPIINLSIRELNNRFKTIHRYMCFLQGEEASGLTSVATQDSPTVTWSGNGTVGNPLIATATASTPDLQAVTDEGNVTTDPITAQKFEATDTTDNGTPAAAIRVNRILSTGINASGHGFRDQTSFSRATFAYCAFDGAATMTGANNYDHLISFQARQNYNSSGILTNMYGGASLMIASAGTITNCVGWDAWDTTGAGTITNQFGFRAQELTKGSTNWAFYSDGTATPSLLRGSLGIGLAALTAPSEKLEVSGNIKLTGDFYVTEEANHTIRPSGTSTTQPFGITIQGNSSIISDTAGGSGIELHADDGGTAGGRLNYFAYGRNASGIAGAHRFFTRSGANAITERFSINNNGRVGINAPTALSFFHIETASVSGTQQLIVNTDALGATSGGALALYAKALPTAANQRLGSISFGTRDGGNTDNSTASIQAFSNAAFTSGSSEQTYMSFFTTAVATQTEVMRITANFRVGIRTTTIPAFLTLGGGNVSEAPLAFTSGTNKTTASAGSVEYDGVQLYFTPTGTDRRIVSLVGRNAQSGTTYTIVVADFGKIVGLSNTAARTITLPAANTVPSGYIVWLKDEAGTAATGNVTINRAGADTIDGATSTLLDQNYQVKGLYSDGAAAWFVI